MVTADQPWTLKAALDWIVDFLADKGDATPRRSAEWIMSAVTNLSRLELYAYFDRPLTMEERSALRTAVRERAEGKPLQYVTGEMPFRRIVLKVESGIFVPRPETEILVEEALEFLRVNGGDSPVVVDLCTGSGCVGCSVAHELPQASVFAVDISQDAVRVARENAIRLGLADRVEVFLGDLTQPLPKSLEGRVDVILANPPYIPTLDLPHLPGEVREFEPALALDGGSDGLVVARRIIAESLSWLRPGGLLAMELDEGRVKEAICAMDKYYEESRIRSDLAGRDRIAVGFLRRDVGSKAGDERRRLS